jgi:hypothetical protein
MVKTKVIRGRPNYVYKGTNYLDQPDKTLVKKMLYNAETNVTNVYCRKPGRKWEVLCMLIIIACVTLNIMYIHNETVKVYYNSMSTYYNDLLYINLTSDDDNICDVEYSLVNGSEVIASGVLSPGDVIISVPVSEVYNVLTLDLQYETLYSTNKESVTINVIDRSN